MKKATEEERTYACHSDTHMTECLYMHLDGEQMWRVIIRGHCFLKCETSLIFRRLLKEKIKNRVTVLAKISMHANKGCVFILTFTIFTACWRSSIMSRSSRSDWNSLHQMKVRLISKSIDRAQRSIPGGQHSNNSFSVLRFFRNLYFTWIMLGNSSSSYRFHMYL